MMISGLSGKRRLAIDSTSDCKEVLGSSSVHGKDSLSLQNFFSGTFILA